MRAERRATTDGRRNGASAERSARQAAAVPKRRARRLSKEAVAEVFRRFAASEPEPNGELDYKNPFTLLVAVVLSAQATDAGVNKATPALFAAADTPEKMAALGEETDHRIHQDDRPLSRQGAEPRRAVAETRRRAWRQGAATTARRWRRCPASAARPPTSSSTSPSASRPSPSTPTSSGSATAPGIAPGRNPFEVERRARAGRSGAIQAARPSLADPARPLRLRRAEAEMPGMPDQRHLPLPRQDAAIALAAPVPIVRRFQSLTPPFPSPFPLPLPFPGS